MRGARDLFNLDYIHDYLGITGAGVRVAIYRDGIINYRHPRFAPFLDPATGRLRGSASQFPVGSNSHGTSVAGCLIAIAPGIELWQIAGNSALYIIEQAHRAEIDVMSSSMAPIPIGVFTASIYARNLATLDGIIFVQAAGNDGPSRFSTDVLGLFISVAAGDGGSDNANTNNRDGIVSWSSRGPDRTMFHIAPHITAPGIQVRTLNHSGSGYALRNGTSMAAPITAGVAALMLEAFPEAEPWEIQARMMNTARQLTRQVDNSVFNIGAGFVQPHYALTSEAFATVQNDIFWPRQDVFLHSVPTASLSFGLVSGSVSHPLTVTIRDPGVGTWVPDIRYNSNPDGVQLIEIESDTSGDAHTFTFQMTFPPGTAVGPYEGNVVFINASQQSHSGNPRQISVPFGAWFGNLAIALDVGWGEEVDFGTGSVAASRTVTISNMGNVPADLSLRLTGEDANRFRFPWHLSGNLHTIPVGGSDWFTVIPNVGFATGVFTATVEVIGGGRVLWSFDLRFERQVNYNLSLRQLNWDLSISIEDMVWEPIGDHDFGIGPLDDDTHFWWPHVVQIVNDGPEGSDPVTVTLTGENADSFTLRSFWPSVVTGQTVTFPTVAVDAFWLDSVFEVIPDSEREGLHRATVTVSTQSGASESFDVRFQVGDLPEPGFGLIELSRSGIFEPFHPRLVGYTTYYLFGVGVRNISDAPTGDLTVTLVGERATSFVFTHISILGTLGFYYDLSDTELGHAQAFTIPSIAPGERADINAWRSFMMRPVDGLPAGMHTATVEVSGANGIFETFDVVFQVVSGKIGAYPY